MKSIVLNPVSKILLFVDFLMSTFFLVYSMGFVVSVVPPDYFLFNNSYDFLDVIFPGYWSDVEFFKFVVFRLMTTFMLLRCNKLAYIPIVANFLVLCASWYDLFIDIYNISWQLEVFVSILFILWTFVLPIFGWLWLLCTRRFKPAQVSARKVFIITLLVFATLYISIWLMMVILLCFLLLHLFGKGTVLPPLFRYEKASMLYIALLIMVCFSGGEMGVASHYAVIVLPMALYLLVCRYFHLSYQRNEILLLMLAYIVFIFAQYMLNAFRLAMLLASMVLVAVVVVRFSKQVRKIWLSVTLYFMLAVVMPVLSLGYLPYTVLEGSRSMRFTQFSYSPFGLLYVISDDGIGIRDRYSIVLPIDSYESIKMLTHDEPLCILVKDGKSQVYNLYDHTFCLEQWCLDIICNNDGTLLIKTHDGEYTISQRDLKYADYPIALGQ